MMGDSLRALQTREQRAGYLLGAADTLLSLASDLALGEGWITAPVLVAQIDAWRAALVEEMRR